MPFPDEQGTGEGQGLNVNLPLARGTGDDDYLQTLESAINTSSGFSPGALVIALGTNLSAFREAFMLSHKR